MANERIIRLAEGYLAGAIAASVWAAQMGLDKRVFKTSFDDVELLGKALTKGPRWRMLGWALHLQNGALFGALYAAFGPYMPLRARAKGPAAAMGENFLTWPLTFLTDRLHPAREELPAIFSDLKAFLASCWRHLLFGVILGELERRVSWDQPLPSSADTPG